MAFKQQERMGRLSTVLGQDELVLLRFNGTDKVNDLFEYHVACLAANDNIDFDALIGTHATVSIKGLYSQEHHFDGLVTEARWLGAGEGGCRYELVLKPWLFLATMRRHHRIFHEKTIPDIIKEVLSAYGSAGSVVDKLTSPGPTMEYTVQHGESDFTFVTRLMERHGFSYSFAHIEGSHDMVLTDTPESHDMAGDFPVKPYSGHHQEKREHFWEWGPKRRMTTGAIRMTDYNFKTPTVAMEKDQNGGDSYEHGQIESFDYPGNYLDPGRGSKMVSINLDRERGQGKRFEALGDTVSLKSGLRFSVAGDSDDVPGRGEEYIVLVARHSYTSDSYASGGASSDGFSFTGRYTLMPSNAPLMPEKKTTETRIFGPQTAVVVGHGEIDCDEYGRILVKFHWDLDESYSMRCRVAQNWAGGGWGGMIVPRIGMEVLVEFINGDPDHPLVTGCVYNAKNMVAYPLPNHKTKSVFRTDTHEGSGFNEMVFEDESGEEHIAFKAQQDMSRLVLKDTISRVKGSDVEAVEKNKYLEAGKYLKVDAGKSANITVGSRGAAQATDILGMMILLQKAKRQVNKGGSTGSFGSSLGSQKIGLMAGSAESGRWGMLEADETGSDANDQMRKDGTKLGEGIEGLFQSDDTLNIFATKYRSDTTGHSSAETVAKTKALTVGGKLMEFIQKDLKTDVGMTQETNVGKSILNRTMKHTLVATQKFVIAGPGGSIEIDASGITLKAFTVKVQSPSVDFNIGVPNVAEVLAAAQALAMDTNVMM